MSSRAQLYQYKGNRCKSCGITVEEMITRYGTFNRLFEFHHVNPQTKDIHYTKLMKQRLSRRQLDEIDKCVLVCTQCHAILHAQNITATLDLSAQFEERVVTQSVQGWIRFDRVEHRFTFVTNQPSLLQRCEVRVGSEPPFTLFLLDVEQKMHTERWIQDIDIYKSVEVRLIQKSHHYMRIEHKGEDRFAVTQSIGLALTALEFHPHDNPKEQFYFRNGFVMTTSGQLLTEGEISYNARQFVAPPHTDA